MKVCIAAVCLAGSLLTSGAVSAQDAIPNLLGTWEMSEVTGQTWRGEPLVFHDDVKVVLEITKQDGPILSGVIRWRLAEGEGHLHDGEMSATRAEEQIMGVLNLDGETFTIVEHPDTTVRQLRLNEDGTLDVVGYEGGPHAVVARSTYIRQ